MATARSSGGAANTSASPVTMARTTASATSWGDLVRTPGGSSMSFSANMPASRMNPGATSDAWTGVPSRSWCSDRVKPRRPNFVALYIRVFGVATMPESDPTAPTFGQCVLHERQRHLDRGPQVDVHDQIGTVGGDLLDRPVVAHPGVEHEDVAAEGLLGQPIDVEPVGQVGDDDLATRSGRQIDEQFAAPGGEHQFGTTAGELRADRRAEPSAGSRHHDPCPTQFDPRLIHGGTLPGAGPGTGAR